MSDTDETKRPAKTLSLKKTETSTVKQSFSHGRTKAVVVEKKRTLGTPGVKAPAEKPAPVAEKQVAAEVKPAIPITDAKRLTGKYRIDACRGFPRGPSGWVVLMIAP